MQFPVHLHVSISPLSSAKVFDLMILEVREPGHLHSLPQFGRDSYFTDETVYLPVPLMLVIGTIMTSLALTSLRYSSSDEVIVNKILKIMLRVVIILQDG